MELPGAILGPHGRGIYRGPPKATGLTSSSRVLAGPIASRSTRVVSRVQNAGPAPRRVRGVLHAAPCCARLHRKIRMGFLNGTHRSLPPVQAGLVCNAQATKTADAKKIITSFEFDAPSPISNDDINRVSLRAHWPPRHRPIHPAST